MTLLSSTWSKLTSKRKSIRLQLELVEAQITTTRTFDLGQCTGGKGSLGTNFPAARSSMPASGPSLACGLASRLCGEQVCRHQGLLWMFGWILLPDGIFCCEMMYQPPRTDRSESRSLYDCNNLWKSTFKTHMKP